MLQAYTCELEINRSRVCRIPNLEEGFRPQPSLQELASILYKCSIHEEALHAHLHMCDVGVEANTVLGTYLVAFLATNGSMCHAQQVFDRLNYRTHRSWNTLISGYYKCDKPHEALNLFAKMEQDDHVRPTNRTFVVVLQACAKLNNLERGVELHLQANAALLDGDLVVGSALVFMYMKCGAHAEAQQVMDNLSNRDVVSWTALITGYCENERVDGALTSFEQMKCEGVFPNAFTLASTLKACGCRKPINKVCHLHTEIETQGWVEKDLVLGNTLVDIYGKSGVLDLAEAVFNKLPVRDVVSWTTLITNFVELGQNQEALDFLEHMKLEGISLNSFTYVCGLKACGNLQDSCSGQEMHIEIERLGLCEINHLVGSCLVDLYAKCGLLLDAKEAFVKLSVRDVVAWTSLIGGYAQQGQNCETLKCFDEMQIAGISPNSFTFAFALKACGSIGARDHGQHIHAEIERQGLLGKNPVLGNILIDMYVQCSLLLRGREVFDGLSENRNIVSWNTLIAGCAEQGKDEDGMELFQHMEESAVSPNAVTFACLLKACSNLGATDFGHLLHVGIEKRGLLEEDCLVGSGLVDMYAKCGSLEAAKCVFDKLPVQDVSSWTALIAGYVENGCSACALDFFEQMELQSVFSNIVTLIYGLKACANVGDIAKGRELHAEVERQGLLELDSSVGISLVEMYVKCQSLSFAQQVLENLPVRDTVSWAFLLSGYVERRCNEEALECFKQMQTVGISADDYSSLHSLKACSSLGVTDEELHVEAERKGLLEDSILAGNKLLNMYARSGQLQKAQQVFDTLKVRDIVSWNVLIAGYANNGHSEEALKCFKKLQLSGISPDIITYVLSLKACSDIGAMHEGGLIHSEIEKEGLTDNFIGSALIELYTKSGSLEKAQQVFDKLSAPNIVSWNVLLAGYAQHGHAKEAFTCLEQMQLKGVYPSTATLISCLKACSSTGAFPEGQKLHTEIERRELLEKDILVGSTLVDMYAKCGFLCTAQEVFDGLPVQDVVSWTALIAGYSRLGKTDEMFCIFHKMQRVAIKPDQIMFIVILGACKRTGQVDQSLTYFEAMSKDYGIDPFLDHNMCVIDVLGRAGEIGKAVEMIKKMQFEPTLNVWDSVLGACRYWGDVKSGKFAFDNALSLDTSDAMAYVLMSQICAGADLKGMGSEVDASKHIPYGNMRSLLSG